MQPAKMDFVMVNKYQRITGIIKYKRLLNQNKYKTATAWCLCGF